MWNKKIVLTISIIVVLAVAGVFTLFCVGHRTQVARADLKQAENNQTGDKADKK